MQSMLYVSKSQIPNSGDGLFTQNSIRTGDKIIMFRGTHVDSELLVKNNISSIAFLDGTFLDCFLDDMASKANDIVIIDDKIRSLKKIIESDESIYSTHSDFRINGIIKIDQINHTAWIEAARNISANEEIFIHYGLKYWLSFDIYREKIIIDSSIILSKPIYQYESFSKYVKIFYPNAIHVLTDPDVSNIVYLRHKNDNYTPIFLIDDLIYSEFILSSDIFD